jgi:hypothetical protein
MNRNKKKLIILISIQVILTIIHKVLDKPPSDIDNWVAEVGWHYWVALIFGMYLIIYMFTLSCKKCGAKQLWRSHNILEWRWPKDKCWNCGDEQ